MSDMTVNKPLIASGKSPQLFRASASADWKACRVSIDLYSVSADGKKSIDHANCIVKLGIPLGTVIPVLFFKNS